ncbi:MAG: 6,7-dimethyl-8-ribityllumazine synthase [Candidatus Omnitrophota bacterium]
MVKQQTTGQSAGTYVIAVSRFNEFITRRLLDGCVAELSKKRIPKKNIKVVWVPGAFELPQTAQHWARKRSVAAVIAIGCVIRGETYHFELVAENTARGLMRVGLDTRKPVIFGVITTETVEQAYKRSGDGDEHKGQEAAQAALDMVRVLSA